MASTEDLKEVIKDTLENRGVLGQVKARIRAEVFNALDDQAEPRPPLSNENLIINELIREYLEFNKYKYAASVLVAESGQPQVPLDREFLTNELNIAEDRQASSVPLLYGVVSHFLNQNKSRGRQSGRTSPPRSQGQGPRGAFLEQLARGTENGEVEHEPFIVKGGRR